MERPKAPGLKFRARKSGPDVPYWCASPAAIAKGYPVKVVRLSGDSAAILTRCGRLQAEMLLWLKGSTAPAFDGTWLALFDFYERDPESPYHKLRPTSRYPYSVYLRKLRGHIGARRISECDGRDMRRWFDVWAGGPEVPGVHRKLAAARMALCVVKAALSWGIQCRLPGCAEFQAILAEMEFERSKPRTEAPTAAEITRARAAAHAEGKPLRALAYALQFETVLRAWDVFGQWLEIADPRPSAVLDGQEKWIGLMWSHIGSDLVVRFAHGKTDETTGARSTADLRACPMVLEELSRLPLKARRGPVILDEKSGIPYKYETYRSAWRRDATAAGMPKTVWNRDIRAGGITEGRAAGASKDDVRKIAGHTQERTTDIYDRAVLEAQRRVAKARADHRERLDKAETLERLNKPGT